MPEAIDNLIQDLNQANAVDEFPGYPGLKMGDLVPGMAGVRIGDTDFYGTDPYGQEAPYNWRTGVFEYQAAPQDLSNPSTLATGGEMDYNVRDQPVERINIGNTDEKDAFVRTGIGTPLDPKTEDIYGVKGLVSPGDLGGTIGVVDVNPADFEGQIPSVAQGVVTRGEPISIPGRTIPDYKIIGTMDDGSIIYADPKNTRDSFIVPGIKGYPGVVELENKSSGVLTGDPDLSAPSTLTKGTTTSVDLGDFSNTGGDVTVGPDIMGAGPGDNADVTPGYKPGDEPKPQVKNDIDGDGISDVWRIATGGKGKDENDSDYRDPKTGKPFGLGLDQNGYIWNYRTGQFDCIRGNCSAKPPVEDTPKPPVVTPPVVNPPTGGGQPPGGGTPGGGPPGGGTTTSGPTRPFTPGIPLVRSEVVIPTKGTKEVPLPDRQADPFAKLYADLLANSQQQEDRYRYINYDPDQIMNAAMSGFRRRGAMRSLQG